MSANLTISLLPEDSEIFIERLPIQETGEQFLTLCFGAHVRVILPHHDMKAVSYVLDLATALERVACQLGDSVVDAKLLRPEGVS